MTGSPSSVLTMGMGSWGSPGLMLTLGYGIPVDVSVSVRGPAVALPGRSSQTTLLPRLNVVAVPGRPNTATLLSRSDQ